jgi:hypothetical protein
MPHSHLTLHPQTPLIIRREDQNAFRLHLTAAGPVTARRKKVNLLSTHADSSLGSNGEATAWKSRTPGSKGPGSRLHLAIAQDGFLGPQFNFPNFRLHVRLFLLLAIFHRKGPPFEDTYEQLTVPAAK